MTDTPVATPRPKLRWCQFSLRGLMIFVLLASIALSYLAVKLQQARSQEEAIRAIEEKGGSVNFDFQYEVTKDGGHYIHSRGDLPLLLDSLRGNVVGVSSFKMDDATMVTVKQFSRLKFLAIDLSQVTDAGLANIENLRHMELLNLRGTGIGNGGLAHLKEMKNIQILLLSRTQATYEGLEVIRAFPELKVLFLGGTRLKAVQSGSPKRDHDATAAPDLSESPPSAFPLLGMQRQLEDLELALDHVEDSDLACLKLLTNLRWLDLSRNCLTDAGLMHMQGFERLSHLDISANPKITGAGLKYLQELTHLEVLDLHGTRVNDTGLSHLEGLPRLRSLDLSGTDLTDAGLEHLKGLIELRDLRLSNTKVTDAGIVHLQGMSKLRGLSLAGTKTTDAGLKHLQGMKDLLFLSTKGSQITSQGVKHTNPNLDDGEINIRFGQLR